MSMTVQGVTREVWITDSTPLIVLARIGQLDLLSLFAGPVLIPELVAAEVRAGGEDDPAHAALAEGFGQIVAAHILPAPVAARGLDAEGAAVLAAALVRPRSRAVLDDGKARATASALGIPVIGTLGVIARARAAGHISAAKPLIEALRQAGFPADDDLLRAVLHRLGETWP